jgi:hypothetical protein
MTAGNTAIRPAPTGNVSPQPLLVVADTWREVTGLCASVLAEIHDRRGHVVVTTSLRIGRLQSLFSCSVQQLAQAVRRRDEVLTRLGGQGVAAQGLIGDPDPVLAVGDVLARIDAKALNESRVLVVTDGTDPSDWREYRLAERLEAAHGVDVRRRVVHHDVALRDYAA